MNFSELRSKEEVEFQISVVDNGVRFVLEVRYELGGGVFV